MRWCVTACSADIHTACISGHAPPINTHPHSGSVRESAVAVTPHRGGLSAVGPTGCGSSSGGLPVILLRCMRGNKHPFGRIPLHHHAWECPGASSGRWVPGIMHSSLTKTGKLVSVGINLSP